MICLVNERNTTVLPCRYDPSAASAPSAYVLQPPCAPRRCRCADQHLQSVLFQAVAVYKALQQCHTVGS